MENVQAAHFFLSAKSVQAAHFLVLVKMVCLQSRYVVFDETKTYKCRNCRSSAFFCVSKNRLSSTTKVGLLGNANVSVTMMESIDVDLQVF